jgi:CRISPR type IV-associated protein Csf2
MPQYKIAGNIKITSPLHVAAPGDRVIDLRSLQISYGEADSDHMNLTGTTICPLALSEDEMLSEGMEASKNPNDRGMVYLPIFPANDARGRLRRLAATEVFNLLASRGEKLTLETYHGMTCGAVTGQPNKLVTFDLAVKAGRHPFLGLFGGGPRMVQSSLRVNTLWPITSVTTKAGLVPLYYEDEKVLVGLYRLTRAMFYRRIDDALAFSDGQSELIVKEYSTAVTDWMREINSAKAADGKKGRNPKQLHTFAAIEYVVPGTRFYSEFNVNTERAGLSALGLLIHALTAFANKQGIGGWSRIGFGRFEAAFDLLAPDNTRVPLLTKSEAGYEPNVNAEQVAEALDAWATASETIKASELEELYALPEGKKPLLASVQP